MANRDVATEISREVALAGMAGVMADGVSRQQYTFTISWMPRPGGSRRDDPTAPHLLCLSCCTSSCKSRCILKDARRQNGGAVSDMMTCGGNGVECLRRGEIGRKEISSRPCTDHRLTNCTAAQIDVWENIFFRTDIISLSQVRHHLHFSSPTTPISISALPQ